MVEVGRVTAVWRYPVKSMIGERVTAIDIDEFGLHADRVWTVYDNERETEASAKKFADLLRCTARYTEPPSDSVGPGNVPEVVVEFPDGTTMSSADPDIHQALSSFLDHDVKLQSHPPVQQRQQETEPVTVDLRWILGLEDDEPLPDMSGFPVKEIADIGRHATPVGSYVDAFPMHLITEQTLTAMAEIGGADFDVRRFRPSVVVDSPGSTGHAEWDWCGRALHFPDAEVRPLFPTIRCVMPSLEQPGLKRDPQITRSIAAHSRRFLGVYAMVSQAGRITEGDVLQLDSSA